MLDERLWRWPIIVQMIVTRLIYPAVYRSLSLLVGFYYIFNNKRDCPIRPITAHVKTCPVLAIYV